MPLCSSMDGELKIFCCKASTWPQRTQSGFQGLKTSCQEHPKSVPWASKLHARSMVRLQEQGVHLGGHNPRSWLPYEYMKIECLHIQNYTKYIYIYIYQDCPQSSQNHQYCTKKMPNEKPGDKMLLRWRCGSSIDPPHQEAVEADVPPHHLRDLDRGSGPRSLKSAESPKQTQNQSIRTTTAG